MILKIWGIGVLTIGQITKKMPPLQGAENRRILTLRFN